MSDLTVNEATAKREAAEKQICEILQTLMKEVGAIDISTNLSVTSYGLISQREKTFVCDFQIKLEI